MARQCLNLIKNSKVDIFEKNPHPYGLVRTGMAPDHYQLKNIEEDFVEVFNDPNRCRFFGNVPVGTDDGVAVDKLKELYSAVILTYGATSDRKLGLPHEFDYNGVISCR
jgi:adrenodoxin-NADP+ reductase